LKKTFYRRIKNAAASAVIRYSIFLLYGIAFLMLVIILIKAWPILITMPISDLLFSSVWRPQQGKFGFLPFIFGSITVTALTMVLALPVCLLSAVYITEYMNRRRRKWLRLLIDILAAIPSVIFGLFGILMVVPVVRLTGQYVNGQTAGYSLLAAGVVLAMMVSPFIISLSIDVLMSVPREARESALALGATRWEVIRHVLFKIARPGIIAAIILGLARAIGETMAVMMVAGNVANIPTTLLDPIYPLPALIANNYGEMMSIPRYDSALMFAALILMVIVGGFSFAAHVTLSRMQGRHTS
jgi:phosphate transport system permease protein